LQLSEVVGIPLTPDANSSLADMIEVGLPAYQQALEEIGIAATKEHALEKNLQKMKEEWAEVAFECTQYR